MMETSCVLCEVQINAEETVAFQLLIMIVRNVRYGRLTLIDLRFSLLIRWWSIVHLLLRYGRSYYVFEYPSVFPDIIR